MNKLIILAAVLALTAVGFAGQVSAQGVGVTIDVETIIPKIFHVDNDSDSDSDDDNGGTKVYSAKFLCGTIPGPGQFGSPLVPGTYLTAINILNPNPGPVDLFKKAVETLPQSVLPQVGPVSGVDEVRDLPSDAGFEVDCDDILSLFAGANTVLLPADPLVKGFVVIESQADLDVVAVYTAKNVEVLDDGGEPDPENDGFCFSFDTDQCSFNDPCTDASATPQERCFPTAGATAPST